MRFAIPIKHHEIRIAFAAAPGHVVLRRAGFRPSCGPAGGQSVTGPWPDQRNLTPGGVRPSDMNTTVRARASHGPLRAAALACAGLMSGSALLLAGCSGSSASSSSPAAALGSGAHAAAGVPAAPNAGSARTAQPARLALASQSIIYTASLTIQAANVTATTSRATDIVTAAGGYVSSEQASVSPAGHGRARVSLQLKIPVTQYPATLSQLFGQIQKSLQNQYLVSYKSKAQGGTLNLLLTFGTTQATATANTGGVTQGQNTQPQTVDASHGLGFLSGTLGKWLGVLLVLIAAGLLAYGIILIAFREKSSLESALQPYSDDAHDDDLYADDVESDHSMLGDSAFMQRAVGITARFAEDRGILARVEGMMEQADLPLRAAEALFIYFAGVVVITLLTGIITRSIFASILTRTTATQRASTPYGWAFR